MQFGGKSTCEHRHRDARRGDLCVRALQKNFVGNFSKHKNVKRKSISKKFLNLISKKADAKVCQKIKATCLRQLLKDRAALQLLCSSVLSESHLIVSARCPNKDVKT